MTIKNDAAESRLKNLLRVAARDGDTVCVIPAEIEALTKLAAASGRNVAFFVLKSTDKPAQAHQPPGP